MGWGEGGMHIYSVYIIFYFDLYLRARFMRQ